jgi:hypothetical protein
MKVESRQVCCMPSRRRDACHVIPWRLRPWLLQDESRAAAARCSAADLLHLHGWQRRLW